MLTALGQAYWALVRTRLITVPYVETENKITKHEEDFYQLHFEIDDLINITQNK